MNTVARDIKDYLELNSTLKHKTDLFIAGAPPAPVNCVTLYDTGGAAPSGTLDGVVIYNDTLQVIVRNADYLNGWGVAYEIMGILHNKHNFKINKTKYILITLRGGVGVFADQSYVEFSINFEVKRQFINI